MEYFSNAEHIVIKDAGHTIFGENQEKV